MRCYICDQQGKESPAVAICIACGMGLCRDHAIREELPLWESVPQGLAPTRRRQGGNLSWDFSQAKRV